MPYPSLFHVTAGAGRLRASRKAAARRVLAPTLVAAGLAAAALAASGAAAQSSNARTRLLDACVYDLYFQQRDSAGVARRCRCAAQRALPEVTEAELASYRLGSRLTGSLRQKVYEALRACR